MYPCKKGALREGYVRSLRNVHGMTVLCVCLNTSYRTGMVASPCGDKESRDCARTGA